MQFCDIGGAAPVGGCRLHLIRVVWRAEVYHGLIDGIGGLVWEDAGGQAGYQFLNPKLMR